MNPRHRVVRASFYLSIALPLAALACGQSFTAGPSDGGEEGGIVFGDGGNGQDGTVKDAGPEAAPDARRDGPEQADAKHDGPGTDGGMADGPVETGGGCPTGSLTCADGGCVPQSPTNCGTCGNDCTMLPHVVNPSCASGQCSFMCAQGWAHCTTNPDDGCETDITKSPNCAGCGVTCSGVTPVCSSTGCVSGCTGSQILCNGTTCVDTTNDPQNCNGCNNACPAGPPNSQPSCTNSVCGWTCNLKYEECNGNSCLLAVPDSLQGVFVATGGATASCGAIDSPCGSISAALTVVQQSAGTKNIVYVAESATPYVEQVILIGGVTIQGGWVYQGAGQWSRPCLQDPTQTAVVAPLSSNPTSGVIFANYTGISTLDTLSIVDGPTVPPTGQSLFGVFIDGASTQLVLQNVKVQMGTAGPGADGNMGAVGVGAVACNTPGDNATGQTGAAGSPGSAGTYGGMGFTVGGQGGTADAGAPGDNGGPGLAGGSCTGSGCQILCANPPTCSTYDCSSITAATQTGQTGKPGCGGNGGQGGTGGTGGGSSIAIYAFLGATVTLNGVVLEAGTGGRGGSGGLGGQGASGVPGAAGSSVTCSQGYCAGTHATSCTAQPSTTGAGGDGGAPGGAGGYGGQGGGGAGGDSYCYYLATGATVSGSFSCTPGTGGPAGVPNGTTGAGAAHN
ncbi:MAG TPA: hypothetical protein VF765_25410 [Polyangiaceae bacterium]